MAKTVAKRFTRIVTNNASGMATNALTTISLNLAAPPAGPLVSQLANLLANPRGSLHLHLDQAFALVLLITHATRPGVLSVAATMAVATAQPI